MDIFKLWDDSLDVDVTIEYYKPIKTASDKAVVVFPGGGYNHLARHEGEGYAHLLNTFGITAFVVNYRVAPNHFPVQLLDARRAMRFVRSKASEFRIDKNKIFAMGSSAGGHLVALLSTYCKDIGEPNDALLKEEFLPNGQILCYSVISSDEKIFHAGSYRNLLGELYGKKEEYSPDLLVNENTPTAFIWHTSNDCVVPCVNSYRYAESLWKKGIECELHVFPDGPHGLGVAPQNPHVSQWWQLLKNWITRL